MKVNYFFRSLDAGFSIQRVFRIVASEMSKIAEVHSFNAPELGTGFNTFRKNFSFVKANRDINAINHVTGDVNYLSIVLKGYNCVVTVHDIGLMKKFTGLKKLFWNFWWIQTLRNADKVTFISEYTKNEVLKYVNLSESKTVVISNPVPPEFEYVKKDFNAIKPIILHIGTGSSKNLTNTIAALQGITCQLRIIGNLNYQTKQLLDDCKIDYSNGINLSDKQILEEYKNCDIVSFPSIHEGFGMPILEGQAAGRVVLSSNIAPMNEICGKGGAFLIDPHDVNSIHNGYKRLIEDSSLRSNILKAGFENVKDYSAEAIAKKYMQVYMELLKKS